MDSAFKITIPAVKITGATSTPPASDKAATDLLPMTPDNCLSATEMKSMPFPETPLSLVPTSVCQNIDVVSAQGTESESDESELGEFLLDAVQWL